jgi:hypothetical protein
MYEPTYVRTRRVDAVSSLLLISPWSVCLEGSINVIENKSKGVMGTEMGAGPNRLFWLG